MKKTVILGFTIALMVTTLFSCKKEGGIATSKTDVNTNLASVKNINGRLVFKDRQALNQTLQSLMNQDPGVLTKFEKDLGFSPLRSNADALVKFESFGFPDFYESIINNKGEYAIGDTIVLFKDGFKYLIPNNDESLLARVKVNPELASLKFKAGVTTGQVAQGSLTTESTQLSSGQVDARYQHQFFRNGDANSIRKFVFEVQNYVEANPTAYVCYVHTRIKQEYRGGSSGDWKPAGEGASKKISNLSFDVAFINTGNGTTTHITGANINKSQSDSNNLDYVLCTFQASQSTITATVNGSYTATVLAPYNSDGKSTYTVANATW